uniref:vitamin-K-epoxide reductase (warfarin-sensitive) n=1 Tax=Cyanistes caeruleus TaxID=156563 RepID=A0A8C0UDB4_CYACU
MGVAAAPPNRSRVMAAAVLCVVGVALSLYTLHVEDEAMRDPIIATSLFFCRWGRGLGLMEPVLGKESTLNVPNGAIGLLFYLLQGLLSNGRDQAASVTLLGTSVALVAASLWLVGVLLFGLRDQCLICLSTYGLNLPQNGGKRPGTGGKRHRIGEKQRRIGGK